MLRCYSRLAFLIFSASSLFVSVARSQSQETQSQSVAEAAKRAKEAQKKATAKSKVITDDDIETKKAKTGKEELSTPAVQPGGPPSFTASPGTEAAATAKEKPSADASAQKTESPEVKQLRAELAQADQDLDLAKREAALAQDSYYSKPDYTRDTAGKAKIDALKLQVTEKEKTAQYLKDRLTALGASLKPSDSTQPVPPATPQP